jgi:hypothetical protein
MARKPSDKAEKTPKLGRSDRYPSDYGQRDREGEAQAEEGGTEAGLPATKHRPVRVTAKATVGVRAKARVHPVPSASNSYALRSTNFPLRVRLHRWWQTGRRVEYRTQDAREAQRSSRPRQSPQPCSR